MSSVYQSIQWLVKVICIVLHNQYSEIWVLYGLCSLNSSSKNQPSSAIKMTLSELLVSTKTSLLDTLANSLWQQQLFRSACGIINNFQFEGIVNGFGRVIGGYSLKEQSGCACVVSVCVDLICVRALMSGLSLEKTTSR